MNAALRLLGYPSEADTSGDPSALPPHVPHGFRTTASTMMHEAGVESRLIELQLAHLDKDQTRSAYNRAERLAERAKLMQAWSDRLDVLLGHARGYIQRQLADFPDYGDWLSNPPEA